MPKIGFRKKWIKRIQFNIPTAMFSVLVNGVPQGFFKVHSWERGPPFSLSFYMALSILLRNAWEGGFIMGFKGRWSNGDFSPSIHLWHHFLCEPYLPQLTYMAWVLSWFEAFSKLKINLNKRELILLGEFPIVEEQASILGYGVGKLSTT